MTASFWFSSTHSARSGDPNDRCRGAHGDSSNDSCARGSSPCHGCKPTTGFATDEPKCTAKDLLGGATDLDGRWATVRLTISPPSAGLPDLHSD
jgi:hypothetical protein